VITVELAFGALLGTELDELLHAASAKTSATAAGKWLARDIEPPFKPTSKLVPYFTPAASSAAGPD
jgi:hypothetical protein